uniref:CID domain-containing protein n=1 Tax=Panagrellus redivivus TaxID=6233 RepID=A0A7E4V0K8_PANRE
MALTEEMIHKRLKQVRGAQDSVEAISTWILHHIKFVTTISRVWLDVFLIGNDDLKVNLIYVLNDVCQKARKIEKETFIKVVSSFYYHLKAAVPFSSPHVKTKIERVVGILKDREIFSKRKVDDISHLIAGNTMIVPKMPEKSEKRFEIWVSRLQQAQTQFDKYQQLVNQCLQNEGVLNVDGSKQQTAEDLTEQHHIDIVDESGEAVALNIENNILFDSLGGEDEDGEEIGERVVTALGPEMDEFEADMDGWNNGNDLIDDAVALSTHALQCCKAAKAKEEGSKLTVYSRTTLELDSRPPEVPSTVTPAPKVNGLAYGTFRMLKKQRIKAMREKLAEAEAAKAESGESPKKLPRIEEPLTADADHDSAKFLESIPLPTPVESIPLPPSSAPYEPASTTSYYHPSNLAYDPYPSSSYQPAAVGAAASASRSSVSSNYDYQAYDDVAPPGVDVPQMQMPTIPQSPPLQYDPMAYSPSSSNSYYPLNPSQTYPMMPTSRSRTNSGASAPYSPPTVGSPFAYPSTPTRYFGPPPPQTSGYQQTPRRY